MTELAPSEARTTNPWHMQGCKIGREILPALSPDGAATLRAWLAEDTRARGNTGIARDCNLQWAGTGMPRLTERIVGAHRRGDCSCIVAGLA